MDTLPQFDLPRGIRGGSALWDSELPPGLLWYTYVPATTSGDATLVAADSLGIGVGEQLGVVGQATTTDVSSLVFGETASVQPLFSALSVSDTLTGTLTESASLFLQKFLTAADSTGLGLEEIAAVLLAGREDVVVDTLNLTVGEVATTVVTYSAMSTGEALTLTFSEAGSVTVTFVALSSADTLTSSLTEGSLFEDLTPPVRRFGGTWAQATRPWAGDTKAWGKGFGADRERIRLSLGESAQIQVLPNPYLSSDTCTFSLGEVSSLLVQAQGADTLSLSLTDTRTLGVLLVGADTATISLVASIALASRSSLSDDFTVGLEEQYTGVDSATQTWDTVSLILEEVPEVALQVFGADTLGMQIEGRFTLSKVFWPQEGDPNSADWGEEAKQPSNVWVLQAETLDSGFTKFNNLEKGDVWSKSKPPSPSV